MIQICYDQIVLSISIRLCCTSKSAGFFEDDETSNAATYSATAETCHSDIEGWSSVSHQMEMEVIDLVNEMRSQQQDCRTEGQFFPSSSVEV